MSFFSFSGPTGADPWQLLDRVRRDVEGAFQRVAAAPSAATRGGVYPPVNVYESEDGYVLTAELPGVRPDALQLSIEANRLTLRGERKIEYPDDGRTGVHRRERQAGTFRRTVELPLSIDASKVEAIHRHGILLVKLPKAAQHRPRQIQVQAV